MYAVGEDIAGTSATYTGGTGNEIYRSRVQHKSATDSDWNNSPWTEHLNVPSVIHFDIPEGEEGGSVRFQTQARDASLDPILQVNSFASVKSIDSLPTSIGALLLTIDDVAHTYGEVIYCVVNQSLRFNMSHAGDADPSFKWEARGSYPMVVSEQAASTILTFPEANNVTLTCTITDRSATDSPITYAMSVYVATQSEWDLLHPTTTN